MRITARLDVASKHNIEAIRRTTGLKTVTDVLKYSLQQTASHIENDSKPGDRMKALLASDYVGSFEGAHTLSSNYKQIIASYLDEKFRQPPQAKE